MVGKFEILKAGDGRFAFRLKAANGHTLLNSETYTTKAAAENATAAVQRYCADETAYERLITEDGSHYFQVRAANGQVLARSDVYTTEPGLDEGIASVRRIAVEAMLVDGT
jgi:hypothetical protein